MYIMDNCYRCFYCTAPENTIMDMLDHLTLEHPELLPAYWDPQQTPRPIDQDQVDDPPSLPAYVREE